MKNKKSRQFDTVQIPKYLHNHRSSFFFFFSFFNLLKPFREKKGGLKKWKEKNLWCPLIRYSTSTHHHHLLVLRKKPLLSFSLQRRLTYNVTLFSVLFPHYQCPFHPSLSPLHFLFSLCLLLLFFFIISLFPTIFSSTSPSCLLWPPFQNPFRDKLQTQGNIQGELFHKWAFEGDDIRCTSIWQRHSM